ncbi:MAG: c-type cytochrome [Candidatus Marinimicrobia bacterium]|nr:c-type cytochrome [Candidatus Neomarinimicrobiota bacterium]MCF7851382.1 c-type cytochrome [Candidatus Neomarinimicrobiota bacterium]
MHRSLYLILIIPLALCFTGCGGAEKLDLKAVNADLTNGQVVYEDDCVLCHQGAIEGAHRLEQTERWQESADKGFEQLVRHTVNGYQGKYGELPVMGMCPQCSEQDIRDAIAYMLVTAGVMN